jgi:hypothetical protein
MFDFVPAALSKPLNVNTLLNYINLCLFFFNFLFCSLSLVEHGNNKICFENYEYEQFFTRQWVD